MFLLSISCNFVAFFGGVSSGCLVMTVLSVSLPGSSNIYSIICLFVTLVIFVSILMSSSEI